MTEDSKDLGIAITLLNTFTTQTLPRIIEIKKRLDCGERLDEWDIDLLKSLFKRAEQIQPMVERHVEYQEMYDQAVFLYKEIMDQALLNEKKTNGVRLV